MNSQEEKNTVKKVFIGLSGGVDSAVSAALLKKAGYDVTGVFIKVWQPDWIECNWKEDRQDAMRVAAHLNIPFVTLDLEKEYKEGVIDYMIAEYAAGRTPNPDVMCNREVKFGAFWRWAIQQNRAKPKEQGADYIATGHYARVRDTNIRMRTNDTNNTNGTRGLLAGTDSNKDQSYFLWTLNQDDLSHTLFPVGDLTKPEVRKLAKKFGLPNADKKDSQGLCFIGKVDLKEFLSHYIPSKSGSVLSGEGKKIGTHPGALFFTLGERHGFTITKKTPGDKAYYVIAKDMEKNTITVSNQRVISQNYSPLQRGQTNESETGDFKLIEKDTEITITNSNWIRAIPKIGQVISLRTRYRQPLIKGTIKSVEGDMMLLVIENPNDPITPGQSFVMYDGEECLGGGIIQ